jgi:hypothetical protein
MRYEHHWSEGRGTVAHFWISPLASNIHVTYHLTRQTVNLLSIRSGWTFVLDISCVFSDKETAAVAATRGDLGQLAPRKKLLKS